MNTFETYLDRIENQDLKAFTKYLDAHEYAMLEMHFLSFAKEQLRIHDFVGRSEQLAAFLKWYYENDECPDLVTYEAAAERFLSR